MEINMNRVWLIGNVGKAPEARGQNKDIASFSLAVNQRLKGGEKSTMWFSCVAFNKTGSSILEHVQVGSLIAITGKIKTNQYEREGRKVQDLDVIIDTWEFVGPKPERNPIGNQGDASWGEGRWP
jgi:single-strand DNA-binding protein